MTTTISSPHNPRLKDLRRLRRRRERERSLRFLAEGEDLVAAAQRAKWPALEGFRAPRAEFEGDLGSDLAEGFVDVEPTVLAALSSLGSGTRVIGVYQQRWSKSAQGPLCVYLHHVADPGNVGSVLRAVEAFGASSVALGPGCADPYSPKAVRASMGAIFNVPLAHASAVAELPGERLALVARGGEPLAGLLTGARKRVAADPGVATPKNLPDAPRVDPEHPLTLLVGAEREGLPEEMVNACERIVHIPILSESLNAAMAATIALYEMTRVPA